MEQHLSITSVLRYANHDFMNHLHLIKMNLDLGRVDEAIKTINEISSNYRKFANINQLNLTKTVEWLQTCSWRFPALQISLNCNISGPASGDIDDELVQYLEKTIIHLYNQLDAYTEQKLTITVESNNQIFSLKFDLEGLWDTIRFQEVKLNKLDVQTITETNSKWTYVLSMTQE